MDKTLVNDFREHWCSTSGKLLSLKDKVRGEDNIILAAYEKSYAPSVQRALSIPQGVNTQTIRTSPALKNRFVGDLKVLLQCDETFDFEKWEYELASFIRDTFRKNKVVDYTWGNAQKWINMSIKYLLSSSYIDANLPCFTLCYIPLDRRIQRIAKTKLGVDYLKKNGVESGYITSWGHCDRWEDIKDYENRLALRVKERGETSPLAWEIKNWR